MQQQLPRISEKVGQPVESPFYVPDEYEIFKMKEKEKIIKQEERLKQQSLKVHQKGVKPKGQFTIRAINKLGESDDEQDKEALAKLNIVDAADSAVKNRVRQKEPMYQFIDKKREMLLFQMLIDHKRGMIDEFEKLTRLHRKGLEKSELLLEEDLDLFNKFLEANKNSSREAIKELEKETKMKQEKITEIKTLAEHKTDLMTKNSQKIDNLDDLWKYKLFLDKLTPKEFLEALEKKRTMNRGKTSKNTGRPVFEYYNLNSTSEIARLLEESDEEFETYFKSPQQLEEIFQALEERNLFLIANTKEIEQMVEELKQKFDLKVKQLEDKHRNALQTKIELQKQIDQMNEQIKNLKQNRSESEAQESLKNLENQISKIYRAEINQDLRKDIMGIDMLKEMEKRLEQQIRELKLLRNQVPELVLDKEKYQIKQMKDQIKKEKQELDVIEQQRKQQEQQKEQVVEKRVGRPIMVRSWPPQVKEEELKVDDISEEEKERLKYFT